MALCVCKCLNVSLECEKIQDNIDVGNLELTSTEQRDIFFNEKLMSCPISKLKTSVSQQALVGQRAVGRWTLHSCLACGLTTHAVPNGKFNDPNNVLIPKAIQTTVEQVKCLKKSNNFSAVFNLMIPEVTNDVEMKENRDTNNLIVSENKTTYDPCAQQVIGNLSKQLSQTLESQLQAIEDSVRQFRDQKYAEYEEYREKAQRDHKILASIIKKARVSGDDISWNVETGLENGPSSPQLPPLQRRRLSSFKDAKKLSHNNQQFDDNFPPEDDSLDAEDLFDIEGMDSRHNMPSDQDDYDSDLDGSNDEGIQISRPRGSGADVARSLPINMPDHCAARNTPDNEVVAYEGLESIAASIQALARSVHGDAYDLPRPRFPTQI